MIIIIIKFYIGSPKNLYSLEKINYLGKPSHPYELTMRVYVKDKEKIDQAWVACKKFFPKYGRQFTDVIVEDQPLKSFDMHPTFQSEPHF